MLKPKLKMLSSKVALITGAAQGIGLATTKLLLRNGARVSMLDINEKQGVTSCSNLQKEFSSKDVMFTQVDVTQKEQLAAAFKQTKQKFGGIDIVLNNAGIGDELKWRKMVDINLVAVIEGTRLGVDYMSTNNGGKGGTIVNVASLGGLISMSFAPVYCATKHGVVGFSRSLRELASTDNVRVNCVCPEFADTAIVRDNLAMMTEEARSLILGIGLLSPDKVAEGILELITDTTKAGATMTVTLSRGVDYYRLLGDPKITKSKL